MTSSQNFDLIQQTIAFISLSINILMIFLILFKSPKSLEAYKNLLILMTLSELGFSIIDFLIMPEIISHGHFWIVGTHSKKSLIPVGVAYPLILFWVAAYGIVIACFGIHFIFRYCMVVGIRKWVSGPKMLTIWFSVPVITGVLYAFTIHEFLGFNRNLEGLVRSSLPTFQNLSITDMAYIGFSLYSSPGSAETQKINWTNMSGVALLGSIVILSFIIMTTFAVKAHKAIQKLTDSCVNLSTVAQALQKQLFYSLVVQTLIPIFLIHFPTGLIIFSSFFGAGRKFYGDFITITISRFPLVDPLPSMIIIKPYREALMDFLSCLASKPATVHPDVTKFSNVISRACNNQQ